MEPMVAGGSVDGGSPGVARPGGRIVAAWLAMIMVVVAIGGYALYRPAGNADLVDYVATVNQWRGLSGQALSDATYRDVATYLSPGQLADVTGAAGDPTLNRNVYLRALASDPGALAEQIPFYSVKPLYPGLMLVLGVVGVPLGLASVLISCVSFGLLGLLLFAWTRRHLGPWRAWLAATLMVISPPFWVLAQLSSPDALCLALVAAGLFAFTELRRPGLMVVFLLVAILARPNAALLALAVISVSALARPSCGVRLRWPLALGAGGIVVVTVLLLTRLSGNYGLGTLFYHGVVAYLPHPAIGAPALPLSEVVRLYAFRTVQLATSPVPLFALLGVLVLYLRGRRPGDMLGDPVSLAVAAALGALLAGWLAYPSEPERFLVGSFLDRRCRAGRSGRRRFPDRRPGGPLTVAGGRVAWPDSARA